MSDNDRVQRIRELLQTSLAPMELNIIDNSAAHAGHAGNTGGGHYEVTLVSDRFEGKNTLERHRMVYAALDQMMPAEIHAVSIKAMTPTET